LYYRQGFKGQRCTWNIPSGITKIFKKMTTERLQQIINKMFESISVQIPAYKNSEIDWSISSGNVAVCIIDDAGNIYGKIWGDDKLRGRKFFDVAYRKASQVWITGYKTGEYERLVFTDKLNYRDFGIELPDLMGWEGGQPIQLDAETRISCGFSGFKGVNDLAIVKKAAEEAMG
jgi:uncharacterized protein GlcG (DUF336 family)